MYLIKLIYRVFCLTKFKVGDYRKIFIKKKQSRDTGLCEHLVCFCQDKKNGHGTNYCLGTLVLLLPEFETYLSFQYFDFEHTWWRLSRKRVIRNKFDIFVFIQHNTCNFTMLYTTSFTGRRFTYVQRKK